MTHSVAALEELVLRLERVREERPASLGICAALIYMHPWTGTGHASVWHGTKHALFRKWPLFSGSVTCPVPSGGSPYDAFFRAADAGTMWEGEYGALRLDLLDSLIAEYRQMIERPAGGVA